MPNRQRHNEICKNQGFDGSLCNTVDKWMDEPAAKHPGCPHRLLRHNEKDCDELVWRIWAETGDINRAIEAREICGLHIRVDRKARKRDNC